MLNIQETLKAFSLKNVLVIGDVMIDRYLSGVANRMSPEAPVPIVDLNNQIDRLGGAANVALNIKALGANPFLISAVGKDEDGEKFLQLLPEHQISEKHIIQSSDRRTTVKTRIIANKQHLLRVDDEDKHDICSYDHAVLIKKLKTVLENNTIHVILIQDYNKGILSPSVIKEIMDLASEANIPTAIDPKFKNFWAYKNCTLIKPNLKEIRQALGQEISPDLMALSQAHAILNKKLNNQFSLITLSEKGAFYGSNENTQIVPTQKRAIVDVCGAGDTVISLAALGLACALSIQDITILSNLAGGQVCEQVGVVPVNASLLEKEYKQIIRID